MWIATHAQFGHIMGFIIYIIITGRLFFFAFVMCCMIFIRPADEEYFPF